MNNAESIVKRYACKKATNNSKIDINKAIGTDKALQAIFLLIKIKEMSAKIIIWPAVIFAKSRIINAIGFVKIPTISIGTMIINIGIGTPGVAKMWRQ